MIKGENISRQKTLFEIAGMLAGVLPEFNVSRFKDDFEKDNGLETFRKDLQEIQYHHINRFPTLVIRNGNRKGIMISGYRPYSMLIQAVQQLSDWKEQEKISMAEYKDFWPFLTERELMEVQ